MTGCSCDMKGHLSFLVLWIVSRKASTGAEVAQELTRRKGVKPSPGTIYPALKELKEKGLIDSNEHKVYAMTSLGRKELEKSLKSFCTTFADFNEMQSCCKK